MRARSESEFTKENRKRTARHIAELHREHPGIKVHLCDHVRTGEFPVALNLYLGELNRVMVCDICTRYITSTLNDAAFLNSMTKPDMWGLARLRGRMEGTGFALKLLRRKPKDKHELS